MKNKKINNTHEIEAKELFNISQNLAKRLSQIIEEKPITDTSKQELKNLINKLNKVMV